MELLQIVTAYFITNCDGQLLQYATAFFITKYDTVYCKLRQVLQSAMIITNWDSTSCLLKKRRTSTSLDKQKLYK